MNLHYAGARYYNQDIGRWLSQDPAFLAVGSPQLEQITRLKQQVYLTNPQAFNAYSYTANNPLKYVDQNGEFFGEPGRAFASGQRQVAGFLHQAADYTSSQGGLFNKISGFVTNVVADTVSNVADVFDPDQKGSTRLVGLGLVAFDVSTGGEGKVIGQGLKRLPRAFTANQKLNSLSRIFGKGVNEILDTASDKGVRYIDNAHGGNINILTPKPGKSQDFIRVTLDPKQEKIISAGHVRQGSLNKHIESGRFTPLD